ncbi:MAG: site-2 protease family protein [Patescibacteria group bacterium]
MFLSNILQNPIYVVAFIVAFGIGLTIHEFAHAFVAYKSGDATAKLNGRMTLNPFAHFDPIGTIFILIAGFGWGKPVPIDPRNFHKRSDEIKVALAGIIANLIVAFALALPIRYALMTGHTIDSSAALSFLNFIVELNLMLAAFNLLPIYPLDGSHIVEYFLSPDMQETYQSVGPVILIGLLVIGPLTGTSIISTIMEPILRVFSFLVKGTIFTF